MARWSARWPSSRVERAATARLGWGYWQPLRFSRGTHGFESRTEYMNARDRLRTLRRDRYTCQLRDASGRKCLAPAAHVAMHNDKAEARCAEHV